MPLRLAQDFLIAALKCSRHSGEYCLFLGEADEALSDASVNGDDAPEGAGIREAPLFWRGAVAL